MHIYTGACIPNIYPERQVRFDVGTEYLVRRDILRNTVYHVVQFGRCMTTKYRAERIYTVPCVESADRSTSPGLNVRGALVEKLDHGLGNSSSELSWAQYVQRIQHFMLLVDGIPNRKRDHGTPTHAVALTRTTREDVSSIAPRSHPSSQPEGLIRANQPGAPHTFSQAWTTECNPTGHQPPLTVHLTNLTGLTGNPTT
jgi:hypothetical protein